MPLDLSSIAKLEKNRLESDGAYIILLEIKVSDTVTLNICRNTDDVVWSGKTWIAFPFEVDAPTQSGGGELPSFGIRVSNIMRAVQGYIDEVDGAVGMSIHIYIILVKKDGSILSDPFINEEFSIQHTKSDAEWVTFTTSGAVNLRRRVPERFFLKNFCPFKYKGPECKASSPLATCNKSLSDCRLRGNAKRFGGEPAIPEGGMYAKRT